MTDRFAEAAGFAEGVGFTLLVVLVLLIGVMAFQGDTPRLIAYGCDGASGPLYAQEEDHFPPCHRIEEN